VTDTSERTRETQADGQRSLARERVETELLGDVLDFDRELGRLEAVAGEVRFPILYLLAGEDGLSSGELADLTGRKQRDLYHHLDTLEETALGRKRTRDGSRFYELSALGDRLIEPLFETLRERADER
jgi:DNA-binding transcriptional ArsR family regulator